MSDSSLTAPQNVFFGLIRLLLISALIGLGTIEPARAQPEIEDAFPNLSFTRVTDIQAPTDGSNRLFVVERAGRIYVFTADSGASQKSLFLDVSGQVDTQGEGGLLGLAFHPDYDQNGRFFVYYTTSQDGPFRSVVARYTVSDSDRNQADSGSEQVVLEVDQPYTNHNAGQLQFGPDGYLYVGLGDGGSGGDPEENGQDPTTLLGSMLRLDVDVDGSGASPECGNGAYEVPSGNPFVGEGDASCNEIYAYGFRNPYRYSFGPEGRLWVADVGQNSWEEIDWVEKGANYGWDVMEGAHCYEPSSGCDQSGLELPIFEYSHDEGNSITGGYVYEGSCGYIDGRYIYGDYGNGRIWALDYDDSGAVSNELLIDSGLSLTTFGVGPDAGLYFAGIFDNAFYQFVCSSLPVELTRFTGQLDGARVQLRWETASETNNAGFYVERRVLDGTDEEPAADVGSGREDPEGEKAWTQIGFVDGEGTTTQTKRYGYTDDAYPLVADRLAYRLRQVDADGSVSYSKVRTIALGEPEEVRLSSPFPNPAAGPVTLRYVLPDHGGATSLSIRVFDVMGRRVKTLRQGVEEGGRKERTVPTASLSPGVYVIQLQAGDVVKTERLTVVE